MRDALSVGQSRVAGLEWTTRVGQVVVVVVVVVRFDDREADARVDIIAVVVVVVVVVVDVSSVAVASARGVHTELLVGDDLGHEGESAVLHGDEYGLAVLAHQPLVARERRYAAQRVRIDVLLEHLGLARHYHRYGLAQTARGV